MESPVVYTESSGLSAAIARLNALRECIIRRIAWDEHGMELVVELDYIWTDDGKVCFTVGAMPKRLTLTFSLVTLLMMKNALTGPMLEHPDRMNWGVSEIAQLHVIPPQELTVTEDFVAVRFVWEGPRSIEVASRQVSIALQ